MGKRSSAKPQQENAKPVAAAAKAVQQLAGDPGPVVMTLAVNPVTGKGTITSNAASERDWQMLDELLGGAGQYVRKRLVAAAEARVAAKMKGESDERKTDG